MAWVESREQIVWLPLAFLGQETVVSLLLHAGKSVLMIGVDTRDSSGLLTAMQLESLAKAIPRQGEVEWDEGVEEGVPSPKFLPHLNSAIGKLLF